VWIVRAVRALKKILQEDPAPDLLIVAHKGTLRVLENSLSGKRADEPWQTIDTGNWRVVTL
jgi:broad specificity phosphatase PhoE